MSLFFENHDLGRMVNQIKKGLQYRDSLSKLFATLLLTLKGTPFIYQGQEIGMVNGKFQSLSDFRDTESLMKIKEWENKGIRKKEILKRLNLGSRDLSRIAYRWDGTAHGGFSVVEPWIKSGERDQRHHFKAQKEDSNSVYHYYKNLIQLRKEHQVFVNGDINFIKTKGNHFMAYERSDDKETFIIVMNITHKKRIYLPYTKEHLQKELIFKSGEPIGVGTKSEKKYGPYESRVYRILDNKKT